MSGLDPVRSSVDHDLVERVANVAEAMQRAERTDADAYSYACGVEDALRWVLDRENEFCGTTNFDPRKLNEARNSTGE